MLKDKEYFLKEINSLIDSIDKNVYPNDLLKRLEKLEKEKDIESLGSYCYRAIIERLIELKRSIERYNSENGGYYDTYSFNKINLFIDRLNTLYVSKKIPSKSNLDMFIDSNFTSSRDVFNFKQMEIAVSESKVGSLMEENAVTNFLLENDMNYLKDSVLQEGFDFKEKITFPKTNKKELLEKNLMKLINISSNYTKNANNMEDKHLIIQSRIRFIRVFIAAIVFCITMKISSSLLGKSKTTLIGIIAFSIMKAVETKELRRVIVILEDRIENLENRIDEIDDELEKKNLKILKSDLESQLTKARKQMELKEKAEDSVKNGVKSTASGIKNSIKKNFSKSSGDY